MNAKDYLKSYGTLKHDMDNLQRMIAGLEDSTLQASDYQEHIKGSERSSNVERLALKLYDLKEKYTLMFEEALRKQAEILEALELLEDPVERDILYMMYIERKKYYEIADELYFSDRTVWYKKNSGLKHLDEVLSAGT